MFSAKCPLFHLSVLTTLLVQLVILCCVSLQKFMRDKILCSFSGVNSSSDCITLYCYWTEVFISAFVMCHVEILKRLKYTREN